MLRTKVSVKVADEFGSAFSRFHTLLIDSVLPSGMSLGQVRTLVALRDGGPTRVTALAEVLRVTQPTTSNVVKRMEARGWVARVVDNFDRRVVVVCLAPAGWEVLNQFMALRSERLRQLFSKLPDEHRQAVVAVIPAFEKLIEIAKAEIAEQVFENDGAAEA